LCLFPKAKSNTDLVSEVAQGYYDSDNAFNFYRQVRVCGLILGWRVNPSVP